MFVCLECGKTFNEPKNYVEKHGLDTPPYEEFSGSPCCAGAYTEAHKCGCCGEWITDRYIKLESGDRFCENCFSIKELDDE